jgi:hypothetical protein
MAHVGERIGKETVSKRVKTKPENKLKSLGRSIARITRWEIGYQSYVTAAGERGAILIVKNDHGKIYQFYVDEESGMVMMYFSDPPTGYACIEAPATIEEIIYIMNHEAYHEYSTP